MTPLVPVAAAAGIGLLLALTRKKLPAGVVPLPGGGHGVIVQPPPQVITVPHPTIPRQGTTVVVHPPPVVVPTSTGLPQGGNLGQQGFSNTIDDIIQQQLNAAGAAPGPDTTPPAGDTGLAPLPPPQVVSDGAGGLTTVQPRVPGDVGTQQFGSTIDQIIAQQLANAGAPQVSGNNWQARAMRASTGRAFGGGMVGRAGYGW
jgi:hypothetical protein